MRLTFGVNPYDLKPDEQARYHVVGSTGFIHQKFDYLHIAANCAQLLSDTDGGTDPYEFAVFDTREQAIEASYRNGEGK